jgi:hypothetical protein
MRRPSGPSRPGPRTISSLASLWSQLRLVGWPALLIVTVVAGLFVFVLFDGRDGEIATIQKQTVGPLDAVPDTRVSGYDAAWLRGYASRLGLEGREIYCRSQLLFDFAFPVVYAAGFGVALALAFSRTGPAYPHFRFVLVAPALAAVFDWLENVFLYFLIRRFPAEFSSDQVQLASAFTQLKWLAVFAAGVFALVGVITSVRYTWKVKRARPAR